MTPEIVKVDRGRYDQIEGEAWERYLLGLIRGWATEQRRLDVGGRKVPKEIRLVGDGYPSWGFEIVTVSTLNGRESTSKFPIGDLKDRGTAEEAILDMLRYISEGD
jgi:hypothetical protein